MKIISEIRLKVTPSALLLKRIVLAVHEDSAWLMRSVRFDLTRVQS